MLEVALIGLFFLVRDTDDKVACSSQATIMIVVLVLTAAFHFVMEQHLRPLTEFLPVTLEDSAVDAERRRFLTIENDQTQRVEGHDGEGVDSAQLDGAHRRVAQTSMAETADHARNVLSRLKNDTAIRVLEIQARVPKPIDRSRRQEVGDQLSAAIASYPDELTDLSPEEREAQVKAAYQDPVTREPAPIIWIPQDPAGISEDAIKQVAKYGRHLQYSNAGAFLTRRNKCEVTQPAPDVRPDWLLDWVL